MNILQICHKPPYPPIDGASIAMFNLYRGLTKLGHRVHVFALNTNKQHCDITSVPKEFMESSSYTLADIDISIKPSAAFANLFSRDSYHIIRFYSKSVEDQLAKLLSKNTYDLILMESLYSTPYLSLIDHFHKAKIILRTHNVEFNIVEHLRDHEKNPIKRWYWGLLAKRLKKYELETLKKVDLIASISNVDNSVFKKELCPTSMIHLPFGINFEDDEYKDYVLPEQEELVLFHIGSMNWAPHKEAMKWFLVEVWSLLNRKHPNLKLHLAGSHMPNWIIDGDFKNIIVTNGYAEGKTFMSKKAIMIVPSFSGSGIRVKIAEGMARGKVIVTTQNGAMGIPCTHNENVFISDDPSEWVAIISKLISDLDLVKRISINARRFAMKEFDHVTVADTLIKRSKDL